MDAGTALRPTQLVMTLTADQNPKYIVSAWAQENGLLLGQLKVDEITAVPQLLRVQELKGCSVTLDAMGLKRTSPKKSKRPTQNMSLP